MPYKKATRAEKRVMIAKDVISLVATKQINPIRGYGYISIFDGDWSKDTVENGSQPVIDILPQVNDCQVCGIGGLFYADLCRNNGITARDATKHKQTDIHNRLKNVFTSKQLYMIESAFEMSWDSRHLSTKDNDLTIDFEEDVWDSNKRLIAIMKNIIKNNGTFKP